EALPAGPKLTFLLRRSSIEVTSAREADDVIDPRSEIGNFSVSAEIFKYVRLRHRDVHIAQIQQIIEIGSGAIGDDRNDPQIVTVVEDLRQLVGEGHVSP